MYHSSVYEHETSSNFDDGSSEYENKYTLAVVQLIIYILQRSLADMHIKIESIVVNVTQGY